MKLSINIAVLLVLMLITNGCAGKKSADRLDADGTNGNSMNNGSMDTNADNNGMGDNGAMSNNGGLSTIYFGYDQASLSSEARANLKKDFQALNKNKSTLLIEGHCDERGTDEYNIALGEKRAKSIKDYLVNLGMPSSRISIISYGEERPAVSGQSEEAWAKNRRGELVVSGKQ